ncbi:MAG: SapC family protein [Ramlibacter sp.]|nr:SapC family protein [Ramlibacter sp.]
MKYAAPTAAAALVAAELPQAMHAFPLVFLPQGDGFMPAALLGLRPQENLFVSSEGRWLAGYVPAALRAHPFAFVQASDGQRVLCIDEDSGLIAQGAEGEAFFAPDGQPAKALMDVLEALRLMDGGRPLLEKSCAELKAQGLIQTWDLHWRSAEGEQKVNGIFKIDEAAMQKVSDEDFLKLRHSGALPLAYCQLLSMHKAETLARLAQSRVPAAAKPSSQDDLAFLSKEGVLRFN